MTENVAMTVPGGVLAVSSIAVLVAGIGIGLLWPAISEYIDDVFVGLAFAVKKIMGWAVFVLAVALLLVVSGVIKI